MAVAKKCDRCGKYYEGTQENTFSYEENGKIFYVDSFRMGKWNAKTKGWDNIVSAYDLCKDCGSEIAHAIFAKGELETRTPAKISKHKEVSSNGTNESDNGVQGV